MRRLKKNPPPVLVENSKKNKKKGKRSSKKNFCKENTEPTVIKKAATKMFSSWDTCLELGKDIKSIYNELHELILNDIQLKMNHFPHEGVRSLNEVGDDNIYRTCARCREGFQISDGLYMSSSKCHYHPRKAVFVGVTKEKVHGCCNAPIGSAPCTVSNNHVTVQHRRRPLTKTSSRRHVRRDLQHSIFALDCEMCYTTDGLEVVRVGLVNLDGLAVYDGFVKPKGKILDYNTLYSGVDKSHLLNVNVTTDDVKKILSGHIHEDTILVGHALNNDLSALGLIHGTVVDTSVLYADPMIPTRKPALKALASQYLGLKIQDSLSGHDCVDDARATLKLVLGKVPRSAPPMPFSGYQPPAAKQPPSTLWRPEQRPFAEIQNFSGLHSSAFLPGSYKDYATGVETARNSTLLYDPHLGCYTTPYLRGGVLSPCPSL